MSSTPVRLDKSTLTPISPVTLDKSTLAPIGGQTSGFQHFIDNTGLTTGGRSIPEQAVTEASQFVQHPIQSTGEIAKSIPQGYAASEEAQRQRVKDHFNQGDYFGAAMHSLYWLLTPVGGGNMGRAADQMQGGDFTGAAGSMALPAASVIAASPAVREAGGAAVNATREAVGSAIDKNAGRIGKVASIGAGAKIGGPVGAGVGYVLAPTVTKGIHGLADIIKPGQSPIEMLPLTKQVLGSESFQRFLNSPGIEGEAQAATPTEPLFPWKQAPPTAPAAADFVDLIKQAQEKPASPSTWPPERPSAIQPPKFGGRADFLEDKGFQEAGRNDIEAQARQVFSQQKKEWFAANAPQFTKGELTGKVDPTVYEVAAKNSLGKDAPSMKVSELAAKLREQDQDMASLLQKSIDQVNRQKAMQPPPFPGAKK